MKKLIAACLSFAILLTLPVLMFAQPAHADQATAPHEIFDNKLVYLAFKGTSFNINVRAIDDARADRNGAIINSWEHTGHTTQQFRIQHVGDGKVLLRLQSSQQGKGRVIDVLRNGKPIQSGMKLQIFSADDAPAQQFYIGQSGGYYYFLLASNPDLAITSADVRTDGPQLTVSPFRNDDGQLFRIELAEPEAATLPGGVAGTDSGQANQSTVADLQLYYDNLVANGIKRDFTQYTRFTPKVGTYYNCTYLTSGRIKEKLGYDYQFTQNYGLNGNKWYTYSPDDAERQEKFATLQDAISHYGPAVENLVLSFQKSYGSDTRYGHVLLVEAVVDGYVYYSDVVRPTQIEKKTIDAFFKEYNKLYGSLVGVVKLK